MKDKELGSKEVMLVPGFHDRQDENGATVWPPSDTNPDGIQRYQPYGKFADDAGEAGSTIPSFTGKFAYPGTGNHYFNARYHTSDTGTTQGPMQFMSPDPVYGNLSDPLSWNRYAYRHNNPVNYIDPDGRDLHACTEYTSDWVLPYVYSDNPKNWLALGLDYTLGTAFNAFAFCVNHGVKWTTNWDMDHVTCSGVKTYPFLVTSAEGFVGPGALEYGNAYALDPKTLEIHKYVIYGAGPGFGAGGSINLQIGTVDMDSFQDIAGWGAEYSASFCTATKGFVAQDSGTGPYGNGAGGQAVGMCITGAGGSVNAKITYTDYRGILKPSELKQENIQLLINQVSGVSGFGR